jgi:type IV secretion system protein VirB2
MLTIRPATVHLSAVCANSAACARYARQALPALAILALAALPEAASAQGFDKISNTITNLESMLTSISVAVVTIAIIWAGFKMIFQGAHLADVANILIGGTLIGGAAAFASYIVS